VIRCNASLHQVVKDHQPSTADWTDPEGLARPPMCR
jgi:hypothetical protein